MQSIKRTSMSIDILKNCNYIIEDRLFELPSIDETLLRNAIDKMHKYYKAALITAAVILFIATLPISAPLIQAANKR